MNLLHLVLLADWTRELLEDGAPMLLHARHHLLERVAVIKEKKRKQKRKNKASERIASGLEKLFFPSQREGNETTLTFIEDARVLLVVLIEYSIFCILKAANPDGHLLCNWPKWNEY